MKNILDNHRFADRYARLRSVKLNPRRHSAATAYEHSEQASTLAARLAEQNGFPLAHVALMESLGRAHDIGKITGSAKPERSIEVLAECGSFPESFLSLVKYHDVGLPWWRSAQRGQAPSDKAWQRLARKVDMELLCMFMVADRVDAPPGWRRNAPTAWFFPEARRRGLPVPQCLDVDDHPSEISAGAVLVRNNSTPEALLVRVRREGFELPKGGVEWDELPCETAIRELKEESGVDGNFIIRDELGHVDYVLENQAPEVGTHLKRVRYYQVNANTLQENRLPQRTRERIWVGRDDVDQLSLVNQDLRPILLAGLNACG